MTDFFTLLLSPFEYQFMHNAMIASAMIGLICGLVSSFIILKGWSLIGDAISHAVLPGLMISLVLQGFLFIFLVTFAMFSSWAIFFISRTTKLKATTSLVIVTSSFMGLGYFLYNLSPKTIRIGEILYGKIVAINNQDLLFLSISSFLLLSFILLIRNNLRLVFFDAVMARLVGINVNFFTSVFFMLLAVIIVLSIKAVGALLVSMLLIAPGAIAYLVSKKFNWILFNSTAIALLTSMLGTYLSYFLDMPTPAMIGMLQLAIFVLLVFIKIIHRKVVINKQIKASGVIAC